MKCHAGQAQACNKCDESGMTRHPEESRMIAFHRTFSVTSTGSRVLMMLSLRFALNKFDPVPG